jgi:thioesterase domain-containing protein
VTDRNELTRELAATWYRDIPLAAALGIEVAGFDGVTLTARAPLPPNRNVHGTAFAGSLYSVAVLTGWGTVWLSLREHGVAGVIVVAESRITYRRAVTGELVCRCALEPATLASALAELRAEQRVKLPLKCTIDSDSKPAVVFEGAYSVKAGH